MKKFLILALIIFILIVYALLGCKNEDLKIVEPALEDQESNIESFDAYLPI